MSFGYIDEGHRGWKQKLQKLLGWPTLIRRIQAPLLLKQLQLEPTLRVLDLGCGGAHISYETAPFVKEVVALDHAEFETHVRISHLRNNVKFVYSDAHLLPFESESFDRVLLSSVLQVVDDDRSLLNEVARVVKKNGLVVASVPEDYCSLRYLYNSKGILRRVFSKMSLPKEYRTLKREIGEKFRVRGKQYYLPAEFEDLVRSDFKILKSIASPGFIGSFVFEALLLYRFIKKRPSLTHRFDILFLPLTKLDLLLSSRKGCERIYLLQKK